MEKSIKKLFLGLVVLGTFTALAPASINQIAPDEEEPITNIYSSPARRTTYSFENLDRKTKYELAAIKELHGQEWETPSHETTKKIKSMFKRQPEGKPGLKMPKAFDKTVAFKVRKKGSEEVLNDIYVVHGNTTVDPKKRELYANGRHGKNLKLHPLSDNQEYVIDESSLVSIDNEQPELRQMASSKRMYLWTPAKCPAQTVTINVHNKTTGEKIPHEGPAYRVTIHPVR